MHWIGEGGESDHMPTILELTGPNKKPNAPSKFNPSWLKDNSFNDLIHFAWKVDKGGLEGDKGSMFMRKLKLMEKATME